MSANRRATAAASTEIVAINAPAKKPRHTRELEAAPTEAFACEAMRLANGTDDAPPPDALAEADTFTTGKITVAPPTRPAEVAKTHLLQSGEGIDDDESYGDEERLLSEFVRLHPALNLETTSHKSLQLMADLIAKTPVPSRELEIIGKRHDDAYLRPPRLERDERPCCLGNRCLCVWMARWRYGTDTELAFVCREFLTPLQQAAFDRNSKLPVNCGKCLVCTRYVQTYIYRMARTDPTFMPSATVPLQAFGNQLGVECGDGVPHLSLIHI